MTTSFQEPSVNINPAEGYDSSTSPEIPQRKKLLLKPRSIGSNADMKGIGGSGATVGHGKSNPFGAAVPREQVLQQRGIRVSTLDDKFERKAMIRHYTVEQDLELERVRSELEQISADLRNANEQELPEEAFRQAEQTKRNELNTLLEQYAQINDAAVATDNAERKNGSKLYSDAATTASGTTSASGRSHNGTHGHSHGGKDYQHHGANRSDFEKVGPGRRSHDMNQMRKSGSGTNRNAWATREEKKVDYDGNGDAYASFFSNRRRRDE